MKWERKFTGNGGEEQDGPQKKKIDMSKEKELDMLKKEVPPMAPEIDYDRIGREFEKAQERLLEKFLGPQKEEQRIQEVVKQEVPKIVETEVEQRMEKLKTSLIGEVKGLSKDEATALIDERMKEMIKAECDDPNSTTCLMAKQTAKTIVDEVLRKKSEEKKPFEMPKITSEYDEQWNKLTPDQRKALDLIPAKAHETMLAILLDSGDSRKGLNRRVIERIKEDELMEFLNKKPEIAIVVGKAICGANEACKTQYNKTIEESTEIKEEEKKNWLLR